MSIRVSGSQVSIITCGWYWGYQDLKLETSQALGGFSTINIDITITKTYQSLNIGAIYKPSMVPQLLAS